MKKKDVDCFSWLLSFSIIYVRLCECLSVCACVDYPSLILIPSLRSLKKEETFRWVT